MLKHATTTDIHRFVRTWLVPLGMFLMCTSLFYATSRGSYKTIISLFCFLPALILLACSQRGHLKLFFTNKAVIMSIAVVAYLAASSYWVEESTFGSNYAQLALYILLFLFFVAGVDHIDERNFILTLKLSVFFVAFYCFYILFGFYVIEDNPLKTRLSGVEPIQNPLKFGNYIGALLVISIFLLIGRFERNRAAQILLVGTVLSLMLTIFFVQSRSALFGVAVALLSASLVKRQFRCFLLLIFLFVLFAVFWFFYFGDDERGASFRFEIWRQAVNASLDRPVFGHGFDNYVLLRFGQGSFTTDPHNVYLSVFYYGGFVGLGLWLCLICYLLKKLIDLSGSAMGLLCLGYMAYSLVVIMFEGGYFIGKPREIWFVTWLPIAFALREIIIASRSSTVVNNEKMGNGEE